jgi:hypothetical protein
LRSCADGWTRLRHAGRRSKLGIDRCTDRRARTSTRAPR